MEEIGGEDKGLMLGTEGTDEMQQPGMQKGASFGTEAGWAERWGGFQCLNQELLFSKYSDADRSDCSRRVYRIRGNSSGAITLTRSTGESHRTSGPC